MLENLPEVLVLWLPDELLSLPPLPELLNLPPLPTLLLRLTTLPELSLPPLPARLTLGPLLTWLLGGLIIWPALALTLTLSALLALLRLPVLPL